MTEPNLSNPPINDATLWDAKDVARFLKVSRSWVYHRAESGKLPHLRVGGLLRFEPEAIHAFARGENQPASKHLSQGVSLLQRGASSR